MIEELVLSCMIHPKYIHQIKSFFESPSAVWDQTDYMAGNDFKNVDFLWVKVCSVVNKLALLTGTGGIWRIDLVDHLYMSQAMANGYTNKKKMEPTFRTLYFMSILGCIREYGLMPDATKVRGLGVYMNKEFKVNSTTFRFKVETVMDCLLVSYVKKIEKIHDDKDFANIIETWSSNGLPTINQRTSDIPYDPELYNLGDLSFEKHCEDILNGQSDIIDYNMKEKNKHNIPGDYSLMWEQILKESVTAREFDDFIGYAMKKKFMETVLDGDDNDLKRKVEWFFKRFGKYKKKVYQRGFRSDSKMFQLSKMRTTRRNWKMISTSSLKKTQHSHQIVMTNRLQK